jgi:hypothetical protein
MPSLPRAIWKKLAIGYIAVPNTGDFPACAVQTPFVNRLPPVQVFHSEPIFGLDFYSHGTS